MTLAFVILTVLATLAIAKVAHLHLRAAGFILRHGDLVFYRGQLARITQLKPRWVIIEYLDGSNDWVNKTHVRQCIRRGPE